MQKETDRKKAKEEARRKQQERSAKQRSLSLAMLACGREEHHLSQYLLFVPTCPETPTFTCLRKNSGENKNKKPTITTAITKARHQPNATFRRVVVSEALLGVCLVLLHRLLGLRGPSKQPSTHGIGGRDSGVLPINVIEVALVCR